MWWTTENVTLKATEETKALIIYSHSNFTISAKLDVKEHNMGAFIKTFLRENDKNIWYQRLGLRDCEKDFENIHDDCSIMTAASYVLHLSITEGTPAWELRMWNVEWEEEEWKMKRNLSLLEITKEDLWASSES